MSDKHDELLGLYEKLSADFIRAYADNSRLRAALRSAIWIIEHSGIWEEHRMHPMPDGNTVQDHVGEYRSLLVQENKRVCTCTEPREACSNCETRSAALMESGDE